MGTVKRNLDMGSKFKRPTAMINYREHSNVSAHDWRLHAATSLSKPALINGNVHDIGSVVKVLGPVKFKKEARVLQLGAPSVTAMFLDMAAHLDSHAAELHNEVAEIMGRDMSPLDERRIFDCIERRMAAVVFSFTALESFANEKIEEAYGLRGFRYEPTLKGGVSASYDLEHVEYKISLDEKLSAVVPAALSVKSPKGANRVESIRTAKGTAQPHNSLQRKRPRPLGG